MQWGNQDFEERLNKFFKSSATRKSIHHYISLSFMKTSLDSSETVVGNYRTKRYQTQEHRNVARNSIQHPIANKEVNSSPFLHMMSLPIPRDNANLTLNWSYDCA
jgi:hypothetical protein